MAVSNIARGKCGEKSVCFYFKAIALVKQAILHSPQPLQHSLFTIKSGEMACCGGLVRCGA
ncbi:hypothetical protein BKG88_06585 [Rodentibacter ratti]|uniref:Uncharacterized protein n=1 Tax=Rodentibacter ratti TaxID=1906745 RepID=A0A1V3L6W1_9PAST|nr:hypothetical protein BKG88_06585 [Rodentibacter ratti]